MDRNILSSNDPSLKIIVTAKCNNPDEITDKDVLMLPIGHRYTVNIPLDNYTKITKSRG